MVLTPADSPMMVTLFGFPPKEAIFFFTHCSKRCLVLAFQFVVLWHAYLQRCNLISNSEVALNVRSRYSEETQGRQAVVELD